jgi:co-chaperonin GroES (HSP10)
MIVKPLKKMCLVAENNSEPITQSGIIIESSYGYGDSKTGTVLSIGPDVVDVKVGDIVLPAWTKGQVISIDNEQRVMISQDEIIAVLGESNG